MVPSAPSSLCSPEQLATLWPLLEIVAHPSARDLLVRDVTSLAAYFKRRGVAIDVDDVLARIGADARLFAAQQMQLPPRRF